MKLCLSFPQKLRLANATPPGTNKNIPRQSERDSDRWALGARKTRPAYNTHSTNRSRPSPLEGYDGPFHSPAIDSTAGSVSPLPESRRHTCRTSRNACRELRSSRCRTLPQLPPSFASAPPPLPSEAAAAAEGDGGGRCCCGGDGCGGEVLSRLQRRMRLDILGRLVIAPSSPTRLDHSRIWASNKASAGGVEGKGCCVRMNHITTRHVPSG